MVFSSHVFLYYFLPTVLALYFLGPRRWRNLTLTLCSYFFYGWANPAFVVLMLVSTVVDYFCGLLITRVRSGQLAAEQAPEAQERLSRAAVAVSVASNLALLGFFKYANFGIDSFNSVVQTFGASSWQWHTMLEVTLPVGISFYTFQSMSYTIDIYRGRAEAVRSFVDFACYVAMFPQLVAGPIVRFHQIADQLRSRVHSLDRFALGVGFFSLGLGKKVLLANSCGKVADVVFSAASVSPLDAWYGLLAYSFQIYFDFSGYSDMAVGLGHFFGFSLPKNFDSPYRAQSITEFWQRWHISLSRFLRDNLYIPLGGNRLGTRRTYSNLAVVMLLGGLWHGAAWNFVLWGGVHGLVLAAERALGKTSVYQHAWRPLRVFITFLIASLAWVFFRTDDFSSALRYFRSLFGCAVLEPASSLLAGIIYQPYYLASMVAAALITWCAPQSWHVLDRLDWRRAMLFLAVLVAALAVLSTQSFNPFIYFAF